MLRILGTGSEGSYARISTCHRQETANVLDVKGNIPTGFPRPCIVSKTNGQALQNRTQKSRIALKLLGGTQKIAVAKIQKTDPNKLASRSRLPFVYHKTHAEGYKMFQRASNKRMMDLQGHLTSAHKQNQWKATNRALYEAPRMRLPAVKR
jgi:hypothetical protein